MHRLVPEVVETNDKNSPTTPGAESLRMGKQLGKGIGGGPPPSKETPFDKAVKDATRVAGECQHGLLSQILKDTVFNCDRGDLAPAA